MRIERRFTRSGQSPYEGLKFVKRSSEIRNPDGSTVFKLDQIDVPESWSQLAIDILAQKYFRKAGVPQRDEAGNPVVAQDGKPTLGGERDFLGALRVRDHVPLPAHQVIDPGLVRAVAKRLQLHGPVKVRIHRMTQHRLDIQSAERLLVRIEKPQSHDGLSTRFAVGFDRGDRACGGDGGGGRIDERRVCAGPHGEPDRWDAAGAE